MRRRRVHDPARKYEPSERERDDGAGISDEKDEGDLRHVLPRLVRAKQPKRQPSKDTKWIDRRRQTLDASPVKSRRPTKVPKPNSHALSLLDEQMLVLCRSALERAWEDDIPEPSQLPVASKDTLHQYYGYESVYAAIQVQRLFRGFKTRRQLAQIDGPRFQRAAGHIQFALRRVLVARRVFKRWMGKRDRCATRIQAWYRGSRCRDQIQDERARVLVARITLFQRRFRGFRFWNLVATLLARRRGNAATQIQRCYRGMAGRHCVQCLRQEQLRFAMELKDMNNLHRHQARCKSCHPDSRTEDSLFRCFMTRFVGLHDLHGAKTLGLEGVHAFPQSARFNFMYSILLQSMGDDLEISMTFRRRAEVTLAIQETDIQEVERRYFFPALQLSKNDIAVLVDLAIMSQCTNKLARAASFYRLALEQVPSDYSVPGYLHRVDMLDRLLLNYHRFCSIFNSRQSNVLAKVMPIAKHGEQVRVMVARLNHYIQIKCTDEDTPRFNTVYLTDEEAFRLLSKKHADDEDDTDLVQSSKPSLRTAGSSRGSSRQASTRRISKMAREEKQATTRADELAAREQILTQVFQSKFLGLVVKPAELSTISEKRSKVQITRGHAERLLRELIFIDPHVGQISELSDFEATKSSASAACLHRVAIIPPVLKERMLRVEEVLRSHAIINVQRVFRGFRVRARMRRETLLRANQQNQVDQLYARLQQNFQFREKRRLAATAIQRIYKGYATRLHVAAWTSAATVIQRMLRGYRGRKRATAFREGNLTFYMAERVYQRGTSISGKAVLLIIERCGLSFRLEAYDMSGCTMYPGFVSHDSAMALIRYENWSYAQRLVGREAWLHGNRSIITAVAFFNQTDGQCVVKCQFDGSDQGPHLATLTDCIHAINLRSLGMNGIEAEQLLLPLTTDDTTRIVACIVERLALVPAIPMATKELRKKTPGSLILTVMPPPKVHYTFNKTDTVAIEISHSPTREHAELPTSFTRQISFPVVDGYRGVSIGKRNFRQKCLRHSLHFTKCRCVLPLTTTPAYVQAIALALTPPPPPSHHALSPEHQPSTAGHD